MTILEEVNALNKSDIIKMKNIAIWYALDLQVKTGLKHSRNAPVKAAKAILKNAGLPVPRSIVALHKAFESYLEKEGEQ